MSIKSKEFKAVARFTAKKSITKPVLGFVKIDTVARSLTATDSHRLIQITNIDDSIMQAWYEGPTLVDPKGNPDQLGLQYPKVDSLIHTSSNRTHTARIENMNVKEWLQALNIISPISEAQYKLDKGKQKKLPPQAQLKLGEDKKLQLFAKNQDGNGMYNFGIDAIGNFETITFNPTYLEDALKSFKELKVDKVNVYFAGSVSPIVLEGENIFCLVLPVRTVN